MPMAHDARIKSSEFPKTHDQCQDDEKDSSNPATMYSREY